MLLLGGLLQVSDQNCSIVQEIAEPLLVGPLA